MGHSVIGINWNHEIVKISYFVNLLGISSKYNPTKYLLNSDLSHNALQVNMNQIIIG